MTSPNDRVTQTQCNLLTPVVVTIGIILLTKRYQEHVDERGHHRQNNGRLIAEEQPHFAVNHSTHTFARFAASEENT